jgi:hypothetical protein
MIFWREAWLCKIDRRAAPSRIDSEGIQRLLSRLKTSAGPRTYFCQASELLKMTRPMLRWERFTQCFSEIRAGNCSAMEMIQRIGVWLFWRIRRLFLGPYGRGNRKTTPVESLNLQAGEPVKVKSIERIANTLDESARNRGLYFSPDMRRLCGRQARVRSRIDKIIVDGTGEMRQLRNSVYLDGSLCGCAHVAFGGCPRNEFAYWREIWLRQEGEE